jgi:hypothetical protein
MVMNIVMENGTPKMVIAGEAEKTVFAKIKELAEFYGVELKHTPCGPNFVFRAKGEPVRFSKFMRTVPEGSIA